MPLINNIRTYPMPTVTITDNSTGLPMELTIVKPPTNDEDNYEYFGDSIVLNSDTRLLCNDSLLGVDLDERLKRIVGGEL